MDQEKMLSQEEEKNEFSPEGETVLEETAKKKNLLFSLEEKLKEKKFFAWFLKKGEGNLPLVLAFLLPFLIFSLCLVLQGVYPFGDGQLINYDGWHQYYPFLLQLWDHFHEGTSLLYDWSMGMGTNFLSMLSYYGASPLNLLLMLSPDREFRLAFMVLIAVRIGLAGGFFALFLKKVFSKSGWSVAFFGLGYALCGFMMGYVWNNMWLDTIALYPLLCLGTVKMFREGRSSLYVISLALSLFANYYIGYMSCVFTVLVFIILCVVDKVSFSDLWRKGLRFAFLSLLGGALSAVLLLPAFFGLLNTVSTTGNVPMYVSFYESIRNFFAPLSSFHTPAVMDGLPNITTCAILSLFAFAFLWAKRISLREKLCAFLLLVFLLFSMNFSVLNYFWHGFHFTNMIPYRFAFLFVFAVVVMAYRYYQKSAFDFDLVDGAGMLLFSGFVAFCSFGVYASYSVLLTVAVFVFAMLLTVLYSVKIIPKSVFSTLVCLVICFEMVISAYLGTKAVGVTSYSEYFDLKTGEEVREMVEIVDETEKNSQDFFRLETTQWRSLNDSCFYEYNGISQFASSANRRVSEFMEHLGMPADAGSNRFVYVHSTPLTETALGIKYLIHKTGYLSDTGLTCISPADNDTNVALYESRNFAGLGFMIPDGAENFKFDKTWAIYLRQNALFEAMTGLEGKLLTPFSPKKEDHLNLTAKDLEHGRYEYSSAPGEGASAERVLRFTYTAPESGMVYIYADVALADYVQVNNAWHCIEDYPNFFSAGYFAKGESFQVRVIINEETEEEFTDYAMLHVCTLDEELWEKGLQIIKDEKMEIREFSDTGLSATVNAKEDGYLYTSIPMEQEGAWRVFVDGKEAKVQPFAGSFVGIKLSKGEHDLAFTYSPKGFVPGLVITLCALVIFAFLVIFERKGHKLFPEKKREEAKEEGIENSSPEETEEKGEEI